MIVLGIDPGTASLGYGVVDLREGGLASLDHGVLATGPERAMPDRLLAIHRGLVDLLARHRPALVAVERLFFSTNVQTALAVGQARGVVLLAAAEAGLPVREATPNEVKVAVTGSGAAESSRSGSRCSPSAPCCAASRRVWVPSSSSGCCRRWAVRC